MSTVVEHELDGVITKDYLRVQIKRRVLLSHPEMANQLTGKVIEKCLIYISGYVKCLKYHGIQPINSNEIIELLTQECLDWMIDYISEN